MTSTVENVIDENNEAGKNFLKNVEILKKELGLTTKGEKIKKIHHLTSEQIQGNLFLQDFMHSDLYKDFNVKRIQIGIFGRKTGYTFDPIKDQYFRFVIHLGDPEIYYLDSDQEKDKMMPMKNGDGFII